MPSGLYTLQMSRAVFRVAGIQGSTAKVERSGCRYWSLSWMRVKPSMELPSIMIWSLTTFSIWDLVTATFLS